MKIRATILTPILAVFTVVALIGTGVVLSQTRYEDAVATALDSMPGFAAVTTTTPASSADAGLTGSPEPLVVVNVSRADKPSVTAMPVEEEQEEDQEDQEEPHAEVEKDD